jgi:REP element-mobilizing transposase RayT
MTEIKIFYKRNLPHYQPPGYMFFITLRLADSLPVQTIIALKEERHKALKEIAGYDNIEVRKEKYKIYQSMYFGKFDKLLDNSSYGPKWLKEEKVAEVVKEAIHLREEKEYELVAFTIMPNHVHLVITPIIKNVDRDLSRPLNSGDMNVALHTPIVTEILRKLKGATSHDCNKILNRSGAFWQHESYDHVVRDEKELKRIVEYVLNNPVKAGLCEKREEWKGNYCDFEKLV